MNQTYKTALGKDLPLEKYVNADGRKWLQKNGINVSGETEFAGPSEDVKDALKGSSPGIHTLNDGSRWMVSRDGKVSAP